MTVAPSKFRPIRPRRKTLKLNSPLLSVWSSQRNSIFYISILTEAVAANVIFLQQRKLSKGSYHSQYNYTTKGRVVDRRKMGYLHFVMVSAYGAIASIQAQLCIASPLAKVALEAARTQPDN